jgi:hypothetical protein
VVISGAGDRRDEDIREQTVILGAAFDDVILYQDAAQRGRADGEVMALLREGLAGAARTSMSKKSGASSSPSTPPWRACSRATCAWCWWTRWKKPWRTWPSAAPKREWPHDGRAPMGRSGGCGRGPAGLHPAVGAALAASGEKIGTVDTAFQWIGRDHDIIVEAYDDPGVQGVTCYVSRARIGGVKGTLGLAEDRAEASIACRQVGAISIPEPLKKQEEVSASACRSCSSACASCAWWTRRATRWSTSPIQKS